MNNMGAIIIGIVLFMSLVLIHELGHFIAAKKSGVKVDEFGIGIPPKLFTLFKDKSGTEYTVNLLPLGGFVRLKGEDQTDNEKNIDKDSFIGKSLTKKLIILFGGVTMNFAFAWLMFTLAFINGVKPINVMPENVLNMKLNSESYLMPSLEFAKSNNLIKGGADSIKTIVLFVQTGSTADKIGIKENDLIIGINNTSVNGFEFGPDYMKTNGYCGKEISIDVNRGGNIMNLKGTIDGEGCKLGIYPAPDLKKNDIADIKMNPINAMGAALHELKAESNLTLKMLGNIGSNLISFNKERIKSSVEKMSGPVGAVKVGEIILNEYGFWQYIAFGGMISLALALFNILPLPALDGGRALSIIIQKLTKIKPHIYFKYENYLNYTFFILLLGLGVYIILLDLYRFWGINIPGIGG